MRGEILRSIHWSMSTRCWACNTCGSPVSSSKSSAVTAVTSCTTILLVLTFSWKTRYDVSNLVAMWLKLDGWIETLCFCCERVGRARPGEASSTFGKRPAASTALSRRGESAWTLAAQRAANLSSSPGMRRRSGRRPSSAKLPQYCSAASPMPCSERSERKWRSQKRLAAEALSVLRMCIHRLYASTSARWSLSSRLKQICAARASSRRANGWRKGERSESAAAMRRMGATHLKRAP
mmetsp:Transcript_13840/g.45246  ORF Transcript_13840/g.45246 Transcript_13840/m.45246 type:complete len:237 (-) Transcript_13840:3324-4034(-)